MFNDNGQGVRGDLQAVVHAILMDYDARGQRQDKTGVREHAREPVVRLANLLRAFNATSPDGKYFNPKRPHKSRSGSHAFTDRLQFLLAGLFGAREPSPKPA